MRTPWRMLSDLMSGKPSKDDAEGNAQENDANKNEQAGPDESHADAAAVIQAEASEEITDVITSEPVGSQQTNETRAESSADENLKDIEPVTITENAPTFAEAEPVDAVLPQLEIEPAKPAEKRLPGAKPTVAGSKKPAAARAKKAAPMPALIAPAYSVQVEKSAFEQMSALDHEIEDLRHRLSEKLRLQNAQLRKLIDRYDER